MKRYFTGLSPIANERVTKPLVGRGWKITTGLRPARLDWLDGRCQPELIIHAATLERAQGVLSMFLDCYSVLVGTPPNNDLALLPADISQSEFERPDQQRRFWTTGSFDIAARMTQSALSRSRLAYAVTLYGVSARLHANDPMDFEPCNYPYKQRSLSLADHGRYAYAIVAAYSVVEQLGLSPLKESFEKIIWIPEKRADLERRLTNANVDLGKRVPWHLRGRRNKLELKWIPMIAETAKWSGGLVRDGYMEVVDAIAYVRALRSGVAAHDLKSWSRYLSIHDVANAQFLARRLILDCLGFDEKGLQRVRALRRRGRVGEIPNWARGKLSMIAKRAQRRPRPSARAIRL